MTDKLYTWGEGIEAHTIPADIITKLKAQATNEIDCPLVYLKLFTSDAGCTWYLSEIHEEEDEQVLLFGLCDLGLGFPELGYVSLNELMNLKGPLGLPVERDLYWEPVSLSEVVKKNGR